MPALDNGFSKAFSAIADSNITTLLAAGLLFLFAAGPVRGFGVTLVIGVLASVVSALLVTRVLTEFGLKRGLLSSRPRVTGLATLGRFRIWLEAKKPDLMQHSRAYLLGAAVVLLLAVAGMFLRGFNVVRWRTRASRPPSCSRLRVTSPSGPPGSTTTSWSRSAARWRRSAATPPSAATT
jgi:predicted RND superfamily exporter protein